MKYLDIAETVAKWSKDPSTQVGAVLVSDGHIVGMGYNGFPKGISDDLRLYDRETKHKMIIHAEVNAVVHANRSLIKDNLTLYCTHLPCSNCASVLINFGVDKVVCKNQETVTLGDSQRLALDMFREVGVEVKLVKE